MPGAITALLSALCYGVANLLLKSGQRDTKPSDNGLFPILVVSSAVLVGWLVIEQSVDPTRLVKGNHWAHAILFCALSGVVATLFGRLALYSAISKIGATRSSIFVAMSPLVTLLIALTVLRERYHVLDVAGAVILLFGTLLLLFERKLFPKRFGGLTFIRWGFFLALSATLLQGIGYAFRKVGVHYPIEPLFASILDVGTALVLYISLLAVLGRLRSVLRYYMRHMNLYLLSAGVVLAAAVVLFFEAVSEVPVSTVSVIMGTQPVIVTLLAGVFMKRTERLTTVTFVSSVLVSIGVILLGI